MAKAKDVAGTARKSTKTGTAKTPVKSARVRKTSTSAAPKSRVPAKAESFVEPSISEAQDRVVASKFVRSDATSARPPRRRTLPASYAESHLLLLVRDPETLFAAWDMAPSSVEAIKARVGSRAFAVSTLTLRLTPGGGPTSVIHLEKKGRSCYLKVDGGPSYMAEIGFTTPTGRFELIARSAPCFPPLGASAPEESQAPGRRAVLGYREARALARRGRVPSPSGGEGRARSTQSKDDATSFSDPVAPRVLGGASDLYRR